MPANDNPLVKPPMPQNKSIAAHGINFTSKLSFKNKHYKFPSVNTLFFTKLLEKSLIRLFIPLTFFLNTQPHISDINIMCWIIQYVIFNLRLIL